MRNGTRVVAVIAAVGALLAPAAVAYADPAPPVLVVAASEDVVYPAIDGYVDGMHVAGSVTTAAPGERIRGSVTITVGTRVAATWMLSTSGPFDFSWAGRVSGAIVAGAAKVTVRVAAADGTTVTATDAFTVSAKKITAVTYSTSQTAASVYNCDDTDFPGGPYDEYFTHLRRICVVPLIADPKTVSYIGTKSYGTIIGGGLLSTTPSGVRHSLRPPVMSVTARFAVAGSGRMYFYVEPGPGLEPDAARVRSFVGTRTVTATSPMDLQGTAPGWTLEVPHGTNVTVSRYVIKITYYVLT